jgi:predicted tellurium resistance membrane protein TerC
MTAVAVAPARVLPGVILAVTVLILASSLIERLLLRTRRT